MFTAHLSILAKDWKQVKHPLTESTNKLVHLDNLDHYSAIKRKELLVHSTG